MRETYVDGYKFMLRDDGIVTEWGTGSYYDPTTGRGFRTDDDGRRIALTSYASFGDDMFVAAKLAKRWIEKAKTAYEQMKQDESAKLRELLRNALTYIECEGCGVECPETGHGATLTP